MTDRHPPHGFPAHRALELRMRNALDALEEFTTTGLHLFDADCMQILSIEPAPAAQAPESTRTVGSRCPHTRPRLLSFPAVRR